MILIEPQPKNGKPFRFAEGTQGQGKDIWFNERIGYRNGHGPMLFSWKCPIVGGEPRLIDGKWFWVEKEKNDN